MKRYLKILQYEIHWKIFYNKKKELDMNLQKNVLKMIFLYKKKVMEIFVEK